MNSKPYINSQKGKVVEKMKVAYISGKHIMVLEKLDDAMLREILQEQAILPLQIPQTPSTGASYVNNNALKLDQIATLIPTGLAQLPQQPTIYVYQCKSEFPTETLNAYLKHISALSSLVSSSDFSNRVKALRDSLILLLSEHTIDIPSQFTPYTEYIRVPYPDFDEFAQIASMVIHQWDNLPLTTSESGFYILDGDGVQEYLRVLFDNMKGMFRPHIETILAKAKVMLGHIYSDDSQLQARIHTFVRHEVNEIIGMSGSLSIIDTSDADEPAGLGRLSTWIEDNKPLICSPHQFEFLEMHSPKGIIITGVPGTGKSMTAKYVAKSLKLPLVRFDLGDILGGYVGDSERNMRETLHLIDALAPCVVWIDEMEKGFSTSYNGNEVTKRLIGKFLTWMQEKKSRSFIFATTNDISQMPPEMFRSGRFDEKFYTFMPSAEDCGQIFESIIRNQNKEHRRRTASNLEAVALFDTESIHSQMFVDLLNEGNVCIKEEQNSEDETISRINKFFIGSDIAKLIEDAKMKYIKAHANSYTFEPELFKQALRDTISSIKTYGETNLDDIAVCYSVLAQRNFTNACADSSVVMPFDNYSELRCKDGGKLYSGEPVLNGRYNKQLFLSVRNALNALGQTLIKEK